MRMRQSLSELEASFFDSIYEDREQREQLARSAIVRTHRRKAEKIHKRGKLRFMVVLTTLLGTAALVTWAMFQTLYIVMG